MFEETIEKDQAGEGRNESADAKPKTEFTRRDFLQQALAMASGLAISSLLAPRLETMIWAQQPPGAFPCPPGQPLQTIMEISSSSVTKTLQAVLKILDEQRTYLIAPVGGGPGICKSDKGPMRYFSAYDPANPSKVWPTTTGVPSTGPTLRARVGDRVQITLLNQVDPDHFPGTLDVAEHGDACDENKSTSGPPLNTSVNTYPGDPSFETPPNCFHGSSTTNLHFHGSHISPSGIADNVLLNVRPSPRVDGKPVITEETVKAIFDLIFAACAQGHQPLQWSDWPTAWQEMQKRLLQEYDRTAVWKGEPGKLPLDQQLWPQNEKEMAEMRLPQYYVGAFPTCFKIPEWNGQKDSMGQAPGTHWYHAHKHGSTALNLANGMAGALIIEGDYDDKLKPFITKQRVLVLQQFAVVLSFLRNAFVTQPDDLVSVNGQFTPVIQMNPNEMQMWRIVNACHSAPVPINAPTGIKWKQTAQDGVQFFPENYGDAANSNSSFPVPARVAAPFGSLAAGNRIDLLVQAPSTPNTYDVTFGTSKTLLFKVKVEQDPSVPKLANPMPFPTQAQFPAMPGFLGDISRSDAKICRELHFKSTGVPQRPTTPPYTPPSMQTIDGKEFEMGTIDQTMQLGSTEEWTLFNDGGAAHPFHIHVNPFQVVEMMDPNQNNGKPVQLPTPWVWWDNFGIPPGGYVKIRTRFMDFTGMYVLHCHILTHEDRGMMQLVQVVPNKTTMTHK
jgi:FtsP/CotA-like multicopper oxidase with cupredoxin domain